MPTLKQVIEQSDIPFGRAFDLFIQALIVLSLISFSIETLPKLSESVQLWLRGFEIFSVIVFSIEYQRLLGRMHDSAVLIATDGAVMAYGALLDRILEDRRVDDSEADALLETAARWGLSGDQVRLAHRDYLNQLAVAAVADGMVTDAERRDLKLVARLLGHEQPKLDEILNDAAARVAKAPISPSLHKGKAKKARQYGIRIMHESVFWKALGIEVN